MKAGPLKNPNFTPDNWVISSAEDVRTLMKIRKLYDDENEDEDAMASVIQEIYEEQNAPWSNSSSERKFERFAKEAMTVLVEHGLADFLLLKNDKLRAWWAAEVKKDLAAQAKRDAIERKRQLQEQALAKLSDEELAALGLKRK